MIKPYPYESRTQFVERFINNENIKLEFADETARVILADAIFDEKDNFVKSARNTDFIVFGQKDIDYSITDMSYSDKQLKLKGQFIGFDNRDKDGDVLDARSVKKTVEERGINIPLLADHLEKRTLTPKLEKIEIKSTGVFYEATARGGEHWRDLRVPVTNYIDAIIAGKANRHSFGYSYDTRKAENLNGANYIKELKIWEVSILTVQPANDFTPLLSVECKGDACKTLQNVKSQITNENQYQYLSYLLSKHTNLLKSLLDYVPDLPHANEQPSQSKHTQLVQILNLL